MGRSSTFNYILQRQEKLNGRTILHEMAFHRWAEIRPKIRFFLQENGNSSGVFHVYGQTQIGKNKVKRELEKIGETHKIFNITAKDVKVERWEIKIEAELNGKKELTLILH